MFYSYLVALILLCPLLLMSINHHAHKVIWNSSQKLDITIFYCSKLNFRIRLHVRRLLVGWMVFPWDNCSVIIPLQGLYSYLPYLLI